MTSIKGVNIHHKINIICVLNLIICCSSVATSVFSVSHEVECVESIAVQIAKQFYFTNSPTMILSKGKIDNNFLQLLHGHNTGSLLPAGISENMTFSSIFYKTNIPYRITQYVIYIEKVKDLEYLVHQIKNESIFANYGKFIIICMDNDHTVDSCNAELLFGICWKHYMANIILLQYTQAGEVTLATYFPMDDGLCDNIRPKILDTVRKCADYQSIYNLFPQKFNNFNGCPLIMTVFLMAPFRVMRTDTYGAQIISGFEGNLYNILCSMINATLKVKTNKISGTFNGTHWTGSYDDLVMRQANLTSVKLLHIDKVLAFRAMYPFYTTDICWISSPPPLRPAWEKLIKPFDFHLRISFAIVILGLILLLVLLKETRLEDKWNTYFTTDVLNSNLYINVYGIFFGQVAARRPTKTALLCYLTLWMWFGFFMTNAYQGALISILKQDVYQSDLNTVSGAIKAGYEFGGLIELRSYFAEKPNLYKLYKVINVHDFAEYIDSLSREFSKLIIRLPLAIVPYYNVINNLTSPLHIIPNDVTQQYVVNYLQSDSPLEDTFHTMTARMADSGFNDKLRRESNHYIKMYNIKHQLNRENTALSMHHMQACFFVIIGGWFLSSSLLFIEVIWKRYKLSRNSKLELTGKTDNIN